MSLLISRPAMICDYLTLAVSEHMVCMGAWAPCYTHVLHHEWTLEHGMECFGRDVFTHAYHNTCCGCWYDAPM